MEASTCAPFPFNWRTAESCRRFHLRKTKYRAYSPPFKGGVAAPLIKPVRPRAALFRERNGRNKRQNGNESRAWEAMTVNILV